MVAFPAIIFLARLQVFLSKDKNSFLFFSDDLNGDDALMASLNEVQ